MIDLRFGDSYEVLRDVECNACIGDPPYSARTHAGHDSQQQSDAAERRKLSYTAFTPDDVNTFVDFWHPRTRGWMAIMSCSDLSPVYRAAFERVGRCSFAPVVCVIRGMTVRMAGDGPSSWAIYLNVARPRTEEFARWGTLPGAYPTTRKTKGHIGGKPLSLMTAIVSDYSREGDLVCDPCMGFGTTALAAKSLGRRFVGAEQERETYDRAKERLSGSVQVEMFS
jgi:site-specific DNA-methyltransferase (adenine-specific)